MAQQIVEVQAGHRLTVAAGYDKRAHAAPAWTQLADAA